MEALLVPSPVAFLWDTANTNALQKRELEWRLAALVIFFRVKAEPSAMGLLLIAQSKEATL